MKILIDINDKANEALEVLAKQERRSKTAQAAIIVEDALIPSEIDPKEEAPPLSQPQEKGITAA